MSVIEKQHSLKGIVAGDYLPKDFADLLSKHTDGRMRAQAYIDTGVSISTLNNILSGSLKLSEFSIPGVVALVKIAVGAGDTIMAELKQLESKLERYE